MPESELPTQEIAESLRMGQHAERPNLHHVLVCVDTDPFAEVVLAHAAAVTKAVGARMTVIHVLESSATQEPMDPVEWTLRHCDTSAYLHECMSRFGHLHTEIVIVDGPPAEQICAWVHDNAADLVVLGRGGESGDPFVGLGDTARRVVEVANASMLLVPPEQGHDTSIRYRKVLFPLDGACRSECVLPLGLEVAAAHGAEVVLVHAAPKVDLIEADLLNPEAIAFRDRLYHRNERAARQYLDWLRSRLPGLPITGTRLLPSGDVRRALARIVTEEHADLMVLSATGKSGHADMAVGSVADYLIKRMNIPVLLVRQHKRSPSQAHRASCHFIQWTQDCRIRE